jgi:hypothetical protein
VGEIREPRRGERNSRLRSFALRGSFSFRMLAPWPVFHAHQKFAMRPPISRTNKFPSPPVIECIACVHRQRMERGLEAASA